MSEAPEIVVGRLVRCHHAQMSRPFIARVCQVFGNRLVVEVMNFHFHDRRIVEENRYKLIILAINATIIIVIPVARPWQLSNANEGKDDQHD